MFTLLASKVCVNSLKKLAVTVVAPVVLFKKMNPVFEPVHCPYTSGYVGLKVDDVADATIPAVVLTVITLDALLLTAGELAFIMNLYPAPAGKPAGMV